MNQYVGYEPEASLSANLLRHPAMTAIINGLRSENCVTTDTGMAFALKARRKQSHVSD